MLLTKMPEIPHPANSENAVLTQFEIKITEILHEKLTNTAIPQTLMSPQIRVGSLVFFYFFDWLPDH